MLEKVIENWTSSLDYIRASRGSPMPEIIFKIARGHRTTPLSGKDDIKDVPSELGNGVKGWMKHPKIYCSRPDAQKGTPIQRLFTAKIHRDVKIHALKPRLPACRCSSNSNAPHLNMKNQRKAKS
ncbi:hypothetical protein TNCV_1576421 [Trichonephila clavipes]|nr:hypothetical protein TNCV_1576421 [Trichonephila clavipes]